MLAFLLRRVALIIPTFIGVTLIAFALIHLIPGDPVENLSGERGMDPARRERLLHEFGLDRPLPVQYVEYVGDVLRGDLGTSLTTHEKVGQESRGGVPIHDINDLKKIARRDGIRIAVIAVPAGAAQNVLNLVVAAGIKAILNFSPGALEVPPDVKLKSVDLTVSLESLSFFLAQGDTGDE